MDNGVLQITTDPDNHLPHIIQTFLIGEYLILTGNTVSTKQGKGRREWIV